MKRRSFLKTVSALPFISFLPKERANKTQLQHGDSTWVRYGSGDVSSDSSLTFNDNSISLGVSELTIPVGYVSVVVNGVTHRFPVS